MTAAEPNPRATIRKLNLAGLAIVVLLVGGVGGWATTTELAGAVIAPGTIVVESSVKKVQHPTGGVVGEILVKEGGEVEAGQVVLRLDDTVTRSTLGVVRSQLDELTAREARLLAERDEASAIVFPAQLKAARGDASAATAVAGEEKLFESRRTARTGQRAQLRERIAQMNEEITGLSAQLEAKGSELELIAKELVGVAELYARTSCRFRASRSSSATRRGCAASAASSSPRESARAARSARPSCRSSSSTRISARGAQGAARDTRQDRRAQGAGHGGGRPAQARGPARAAGRRRPPARRATVGGVIGNGEIIMQIVPRADELVVEAKVAPSDVDQVAAGAKAIVRIMAGNQRTTPEINGFVTRVSADLAREPQQNPAYPPQAYYMVRITLPPEELARLRDIRLVPGMPAEVFIQTYERTPLQYLLKPLQDQIARTFRER